MDSHLFVMQHDYVQLTVYRCAYCGVIKHSSWSPGWPMSVQFYDQSSGDEVRPMPPCVDDAKHRQTAEAELALDRLEAALG